MSIGLGQGGIQADAAQSVQTQSIVAGITLSGNTDGVLAPMTSGTVTIAGGNNITLSQAGNAFTISAFNQSVQTQNVVDLTLSGNTAGVLALVSSGTLTLAGGNNITLSQVGNAITISGAAAGGAQTFIAGLAASDTTYTSGTITITGVGGGVTVSSNTGQRIDISVAAPVAQTVQTQNVVDLTLSGNTAGALALISSGTATLAGGNNVTLSQAGNAVTISAANQTVQTQSRFNLTLSGNSTSAGAGFIQVSSGTLTLAGGPNITLSQNGNAISISAAAQSAQTFIAGLAASNTTYTSGTVTITGVGGGVTVSSNTGQRIDISVAAQTVQTQNLHNVTLSGNTAGALAQISSGTMTLAGGNNVTLSQAGNAVTISAANQTVQTQNVVDLTLSGNTAGALALISSGTATLAGGNNITLSQAGNAITISAANQSAQTFVAGIAGSNTTYTSGTVLFTGVGGGITVSSNTGQRIDLSVAAQTVQTQNVVDLTLSGNTAGALALISSGTATLAGGNNITLSQAGNAFTISAFNQTVQTQNVVDVTLAGNTAGALALVSSGTLTLAGGNNITLSQAGNAITISAANETQTVPAPATTISAVTSANVIGTQTSFARQDHQHAGVGLAGVSTGGNTVGNTAVLPGRLVLAGGANITLSQATDAANNMTVSIAGGAGGGGGVNIAASNTTYTSGTVTFTGVGGGITVSSNTGQRVDLSVLPAPMVTLAGNSTSAGAGFALVSTGTLTLAGGNNITLSQNGNAVTVSAASQTVQTQSRFNLTLAGNSTSAGAGFIEVSSGTLTLAGGNNITLSQNGNAITISGAAGGGGAGATNSLWYNESGNNLIAFSNASISLFPIALEAELHAHRLEVFINASGSTASTNSVLLSAAIYSFVNSTSIATASTGSFAVSWSNGTNSATNWGGHIGLRRWDIPITINATPGQYVVALWMRSSQANGSFSLVAGFTPAAFSGQQGQLSSASRQKLPFLGMYTSSTSGGFPAGIPQVSVIGSASLGRMVHIAMRSEIGSI